MNFRTKHRIYDFFAFLWALILLFFMISIAFKVSPLDMLTAIKNYYN